MPYNNPKSHSVQQMNILLLSILTIAILKQANSLSFNFSSFDSCNGNITCKWNASVSGGAILLTKNLQDNTTVSFGQVIYSQAFYLWDNVTRNLKGFSTSFSFLISSLGGCYGDGLAFFLAATDIPYRNGIANGGLGLAVQNQTSEYPFVAVEFDTYRNYWDPAENGDHIGININSVVSNETLKWNSKTYISNGIPFNAEINYDPTLKSLSVAVTGFSRVSNKSIPHKLPLGIDLRDYLPENVYIGFSASTGACFEVHSIKSWNFTDSSTQVPAPGGVTVKGRQKKRAKGLAIWLGSGSSVVVVAALGLLLIRYCRRKWKGQNGDELGLPITPDQEFELGTGPQRFSYSSLASATNNFAEEKKLGQGGFGAVYKGRLEDPDSLVAVKKILEQSKQGMKEYASEIRIISRLRHKNLVQLMGWCHEQNELLLVYEFMPNGSLDAHLFEPGRLLTWEIRYKIARGLASALLYLHEEYHQLVLHRDIKPSNVMLDSEFNAKLGDFGLARFVDHGKSLDNTRLAGTAGYIAPECVVTYRSSKATDVYSFGIVALEIACGRKAIVKMPEEEYASVLVQWVWELFGDGRLLEAVDQRLQGEFDEEQMKRLLIAGLSCAYPDAKFRPSIRQASLVLGFEAALPDLPLPEPLTANPAPSGSQSSGTSPESSSVTSPIALQPMIHTI